ncbi:BLUF domain-containing protein [Colwellia sp. MB3u-70]|uniref:BLUF domain-containing protein n=1 Tax=unclassified Colwellia TaxID=196834 RepID=UPI0015F405AB|nr:MULTISPECIES: BLUF domain-containing protein [unclassified Colwellia]MBA6293776.1 BLUF domain-containing protein [Colwellia sp. MB3u-8]MBA6306252.1 BLUF domain-containing protein [Colwellia sp. MB3u-70]
MTELIHLIYASKAYIDFSKHDIAFLLEKARNKNKSLDVTGMLVSDSGSFLQVLEGEEKTINQLFSTISGDGRHGNIVKIISEVIPERRFNDWTMGAASLSRQELAKIDGTNDFFTENTCLVNISKGRAKKILDAFAQGRWRLE